MTPATPLRLPLAQVLAPAIDLADGYPIEAELIRVIEREKERLAGWPFSRAVFLPRAGSPPEAGALFRQPDLARTLRRLVEAERTALAAGKSQDEAKAARKAAAPRKEESEAERLSRERNQLKKTIASLTKRLEEVEQELGDVAGIEAPDMQVTS